MAHPEYGYFLPSETQCKCGCGLDITDNLRDALNRVRMHYGAPIEVVSGARCPTYNAIVGGSKNSQHIKGKAADLWLHGQALRHRLIKSTFMEDSFRGRGFYRTFIHVDQRSTHAYWVG